MIIKQLLVVTEELLSGSTVYNREIIMTLPNQSQPVTRSIQPPLVAAAFFKTDLQLVILGYTQDGDPILDWEVVTGANSNPNEPMYFRFPVAYQNWCYLFAGFSKARCLAGRRW